MFIGVEASRFNHKFGHQGHYDRELPIIDIARARWSLKFDFRRGHPLIKLTVAVPVVRTFRPSASGRVNLRTVRLDNFYFGTVI